MNKVLTPEIKEVMQAVHYRPAVSVIVPFEPKMNLTKELDHTLKTAADKVEKELAANYPGELGKLVMQKLRNLISGLDYDTYKKSIAIYVSPVFEKVLYLDIEVEEKIIVDESFEIRDLVYSKKQLHKYLVLLLSAKECRMYLGNSTNFVKIVSDTPEDAYPALKDAPERVANFTDPSSRKEIILEKFLHHTDKSLDIILHAYQLPLFVMGADRTLGHFKKITKHAAAVIAYIPGNYEEATIAELKKILTPHVQDWKAVKQTTILNQLNDAADHKKLVVGIKDVWKEAMHGKGRLLVVEKNYMFPAQHDGSADSISATETSGQPFAGIRDAVDDVITKVLENGGDVEFVNEGALKDFQSIALILFY